MSGCEHRGERGRDCSACGVMLCPRCRGDRHKDERHGGNMFTALRTVYDQLEHGYRCGMRDDEMAHWHIQRERLERSVDLLADAYEQVILNAVWLSAEDKRRLLTDRAGRMRKAVSP